MSSYIVDDITLHRILAGLRTAAYASSLEYPRPNERILQAVYDPAEFGRQMYALNCNAVDARYGEGDSKEERERGYIYQFILPPSRIQFYKSLQCYLYQCSEDDIPKTSQLYKDLDEVANRLAHHIAMDSDDYSDAVWG